MSKTASLASFDDVHVGAISAIKAHPEEKLACSFSRDGTFAIFDLERSEERDVYNINKNKEVFVSILLAIIIYFILSFTCYIKIITTCYYCKFFPIINCFLLFLFNLIHIYKDYFNIQFVRVTGYIILLGMFINVIFIVLIDSQKVLLCS